MNKANFLRRHFIALALCVLAQPICQAEEQTNYDRINLSVDAMEEVESDMLVAVLYVQREGSELSALSDEVNKLISKALQRGKKAKEVDVQTLAYQTYPVYQKQRQASWRVRQSIQLKSRDVNALSKLLGELQNSLALESVNYMISPESRSKIEESLIGKGIAAFRQRAQNITEQMGRKRFRVVTMNVNTGGAPIQPMRNFAAMAEATVAAPVLQPGTQTMTVNINGMIELVVE